MVQGKLNHRPSAREYRNKCRCPGCKEKYSEDRRRYRAQRRPMPTTMTRLYREIGIVSMPRSRFLANVLQNVGDQPAQEPASQKIGANPRLTHERAPGQE